MPDKHIHPVSFTGKVLNIEIENGDNHQKFSNSGKFIVTDGAIIDVEADALLTHKNTFAKESKEFNIIINTKVCAWHPTKDMLAVIGYKKQDETRYRYRIEIWDIAEHKIIDEYDLRRSQHYMALDWSPDGTRLAASNHDYSITLINLDTRETSSVFLNNSPASKVIFSPDGQRLAAQCKEELLHIIDVAIGKPECQILASTNCHINNFESSPWHYLGGHIAYEREHKIQISQLKSIEPQVS